MFSNNISRHMRSKIISMSKFRETNDLGKYLGVSLNEKRLKKHDYQYLIEQMYFKMEKLKTNSISFAGRITLAKIVLEAVPVYPMMTNFIPNYCIDEIHKMEVNFICGDTEEKHRIMQLVGTSWINTSMQGDWAS